ncbi:hypothetical protein EX84_15650, partial [Staphylococcus aureus]
FFFAYQHRNSDFLNEEEIEEWLENGNLTRVDLAFSRDKEHKEYVQHRIMEKSKRYNEWIEQGTAIYICDDEKCMTKDVPQAI